MADTQHITENTLRIEVFSQRAKYRKAVLIVGMPLAVIIGAFTNIAFFAGALIFVIVAFFSFNIDHARLAGAVGEEAALEELQKLPNEYILFNQVNIPNPKSKTGYNEADLIVLGSKCVFVIEVKHNNSEIRGSESERVWTAHKVGVGGTPYESEVRNPIAQTKKLVWLLSQELKHRKLRAWVQGLVVYTHPDSAICLEGESSLPIFKLDEINRYILEYADTTVMQSRGDILFALADLKSKSISPDE